MRSQASVVVCGANLEVKEAISSFTEVSISLQFKRILERKFVSLLKWKFIFTFRKGYHVNDKSNFPKRINCGTYMDIMNGSLYQKLFSGGFLKNEKNISFTLISND